MTRDAFATAPALDLDLTTVPLRATLKRFYNDGTYDAGIADACKSTGLTPFQTGVAIWGFLKNSMEMVYGVTASPEDAPIPPSVIFDFDQTRDSRTWQRVPQSDGSEAWETLVDENGVPDNSSLSKCTILNAKHELFDWDMPGFTAAPDGLPGLVLDRLTDVRIEETATAVVAKSTFRNAVKAFIGNAWKVISPVCQWHSSSAAAKTGDGWKMLDAAGSNEIAPGPGDLAKP